MLYNSDRAISPCVCGAFIYVLLCELQVNIRSVDEAIVIGAALSLSSSAFVLQVRISII